MVQKGAKGAKAVKGEGNLHSHDNKSTRESGKEKAAEEVVIAEDDMIQLDMDIVELAEDTELVEELK